MTVTTLLGPTVHDMPVEPDEGETERQAALRRLLKVRDDLDNGRSVALTNPAIIYPPDRIILLAVDFRNPDAKAEEIAAFMQSLGNRQTEKPAADDS